MCHPYKPLVRLLLDTPGKRHDLSKRGMSSLDYEPEKYLDAEHIISDYLATVSPSTLAKLTNLRYTTNLLLVVDYRCLHRLDPIPHIRSLCIHVYKAPSLYHVIQELVRIFDMANKLDDQYWKIYVSHDIPDADEEEAAEYDTTAFIHDSTIYCMERYLSHPDYFTLVCIEALCPKVFFDMLEEIAPNTDDEEIKRLARDRHAPEDLDVYRLLKYIDLEDQRLLDYLSSAAEDMDEQSITEALLFKGHVPLHLLRYFEAPSWRE